MAHLSLFQYVNPLFCEIQLGGRKKLAMFLFLLFFASQELSYDVALFCEFWGWKLPLSQPQWLPVTSCIFCYLDRLLFASAFSRDSVFWMAVLKLVSGTAVVSQSLRSREHRTQPDSKELVLLNMDWSALEYRFLTFLSVCSTSSLLMENGDMTTSSQLCQIHLAMWIIGCL